MNINKKNENNYISDIDFHFNEIEKDLYRIKIDNVKNLNLLRLVDSLLDSIALIKKLVICVPRVYLNSIFLEMKRKYNDLSGEIDCFNIIIPFKENPNFGRMGSIKMVMNEELMKDEE